MLSEKDAKLETMSQKSSQLENKISQLEEELRNNIASHSLLVCDFRNIFSLHVSLDLVW